MRIALPRLLCSQRNGARQSEKNPALPKFYLALARS
jgi:hypothetical protein